jgi:hypothetical protein
MVFSLTKRLKIKKARQIASVPASNTSTTRAGNGKNIKIKVKTAVIIWIFSLFDVILYSP